MVTITTLVNTVNQSSPLLVSGSLACTSILPTTTQHQEVVTQLYTPQLTLWANVVLEYPHRQQNLVYNRYAYVYTRSTTADLLF